MSDQDVKIAKGVITNKAKEIQFLQNVYSVVGTFRARKATKEQIYSLKIADLYELIGMLKKMDEDASKGQPDSEQLVLTEKNYLLSIFQGIAEYLYEEQESSKNNFSEGGELKNMDPDENTNGDAPAEASDAPVEAPAEASDTPAEGDGGEGTPAAA